MNSNQDWIDRQEKTNESRRDYEYERLTVWVLDSLYEAMEGGGLSKADLARALGTSRANITQTFRGSRNLTLRTLSDFAWACGARVCMNLQPLRTGKFISSPIMVIEPRRRVVMDATDDSGRTPDSANEMELMTAGCAA